MSPLAIRRWSRRLRRRPPALLVALGVTGAIGLHHTGIAIGDGHHGAPAEAAIELCLGAFAAVGAAVVAVALGSFSLGRWRPPADIAAAGIGIRSGAPVPRSRAGPALLSLIGVLRR